MTYTDEQELELAFEEVEDGHCCNHAEILAAHARALEAKLKKAEAVVETAKSALAAVKEEPGEYPTNRRIRKKLLKALAAYDAEDLKADTEKK